MNAHTTARTARRRTLRIAAATLTAAAALTLTACSGSDGAAAKPASQSVGTESGGAHGTDAKADTGKGASDKETNGAPAAETKSASPDRTQKLVDGSTAEIYELGEQHYQLKIVSDGSVVATLETDGHDAGLDANGMFVVLGLDGQVHSWMGGEHTGPGTFQLAGGWTAKVTKTGELRYRAEIMGHEGVVATLETNGHDVGLNANAVHIVLSAGGVISSHE